MARKKTKEDYFGEKEEQAVLDYASAKTQEERSKIYNEFLAEPLKIMVGSILRKYPIMMGDYSIEDLELDGLCHVVQVLDKFKPEFITEEGNKTKAYSYLGTCCRNFYKTHSQKSNKRTLSHLDFDLVTDQIERSPKFQYELEDDGPVDLNAFYNEFFTKIAYKIRGRLENSIKLKPNDITVGTNLVILIENWQLLFETELNESKHMTNSYVKGRVLYFLREQTGLENKDIRLSIKNFWPEYQELKEEVFNG